VRAASLLVVFVLVKATVLWGRAGPSWSWTLVAYVWQDVLVALAFGAIDRAVLRTGVNPRIPSLAYCAVATYAALNIPVMIVLSTPLTWPMLRATSATLADSILLYVTWRNAFLVLLTLAAAATLPHVLARVPRRMQRPAIGAALLIVALGPAASARVDTIGLHRNVVVALAASALPRVDASLRSHAFAERPSATRSHALRGNWTTPPFDRSEADDFSHLKGSARDRHVVLVSLESTGAQYLRLYGGNQDVTPHLDAVARQALVFENAYAAYPESIKGLFSLLCSTFPAFDTTPAMYETAPCRSIAALLEQAGYHTGLFHSGRFAYLGMKSIVTGRGYDTLEDAGAIGGQHESSFGVDEPSTVARILSWIDTLPRGQRFFVTYLPIAGHHPYETPARGPFPDEEEIGRYRNALHYADQSLGALVDGLRLRGLDQETIWIVLGDHGEALGQHEGNYGHTFFLYEENVRVPFVIAAPGILEQQQRSQTIVSLVDTAPTILDVLGITIPALYQGQSALGGHPRMALFFTDYSLGLVGLRDGRWKFVHELESGRSKLFDLQQDPHERVDVSSMQLSRAATYERTLRAWSRAQKIYVLTHGVRYRGRGQGSEVRDQGCLRDQKVGDRIELLSPCAAFSSLHPVP
jgi:glucan phosphoethanolaminetransferase (alkaline phosphatase superfamily)